MSTRKPFSIRTQNELNISNKENLVNKRDIPSKKNTTKIINVKTKTNSKIYISKKELSIATSAPVQEVKKEDVENYAPAQEQAQVEKVAESTPEVDMGKDVSSRKKYTIDQLLKMMPNVCSPPPGFENWPEGMRNPKPKSTKKLPTASNSPFKTPLVQKRSPMGEAKEKSATTTSSEPVVPVIKMPEIIIPSIKLETILPTSSPSKTANVETDERRLEQRQKQIDLGKKTLSYYMYTKKVPATQRKKGCPITPRKNQVCSKRSWDGQVRKWRRMLHDYDPKTPEEIEEAMKLFPEETKYLLQKRNDGEDVENIEEDQDDCDDVLN